MGADPFYPAKGDAIMIGLVLSGLLGVALFICFLILGLRGSPEARPDSPVVDAVTQMVGLVGLSFAQFERLLDASDYEKLRSLPALRGAARQCRKDRGTVAILWIGLLLSDLNKLWRFRRFLVGQGAPAEFGEEAKILCTYLVSVIHLQMVSVSIRLCGPFAAGRAALRAKRLVEIMSYAAARVLSRVPATGWREIERSWRRCAA